MNWLAIAVFGTLTGIALWLSWSVDKAANKSIRGRTLMERIRENNGVDSDE